MDQILKTYDSYRSHKRNGIRCEINTPSGSYPLHRHDYFELEIIAEGRIAHELNGVREELSRGEIVALAPGDLHRFTVLEPVRIFSFCVYYKDAPSAVQRLVSGASFPLRASPDNNKLSEITEHFERLFDVLRLGGEYEREIIGAYATLLLTAVLPLAENGEPSHSSGGYTHISRAMKYISENCTAGITLEDVASTVHLTPSYFSKLFSEINGYGFAKYLTEQRVECAKRLLEKTDNSVTDVAFASGFGSFSSFSRAFSRIVGITPREYRKYAGPSQG